MYTPPLHNLPLHNLPHDTAASHGWGQANDFSVNVLLTPVGSKEVAASVAAVLALQQGATKPREEDWVLQVTITGIEKPSDLQSIGTDVSQKLVSSAGLSSYFGPVKTAALISTCTPTDSSIYLFWYTTKDEQKGRFIEQVLEKGALGALTEKVFGQVGANAAFTVGSGEPVQFVRIPSMQAATYSELPVRGNRYVRYLALAFTRAR